MGDRVAVRAARTARGGARRPARVGRLVGGRRDAVALAEAYFGEHELTALLVESAARWPGFAAELTGASGVDLGYRAEGTLVVGLTADDLAEAGRLWSYQQGLGLPIRRCVLGAARPRTGVGAAAAALSRPATTRSTRGGWSPRCAPLRNAPA
ncbi:hypothetical protein V2I01_08775 [Micromonospora sp. BRA006-A]|nr:hypothetical protein [Micromonospora sp. BRA006-A]